MTKIIKFLILTLFIILSQPGFAGPLDFPKKLISEKGEKVLLSKWKGKKIVLAMLYPRCTSACPIIIGNIKKIKSELEKKNINAEYVLISFDSNNESSKRLSDYKNHMGLDWPNLTFLFGKQSEIRFLSNALNIRYWQNLKSNDISHDNVIILLNESGETHRRLEGLELNTTELY